MLLVDILVALAVGVLCAAILGESSLQARKLFERARVTDRLLHEYESGALSPDISSSTVMYGNDRLETTVTVATTSRSLTFVRVSKRNRIEPGDAAGASLCTVNLGFRPGLSPTIRQITVPVNPFLPLTDIEVRNDRAYLTADSAASADPDIFILDIHHPSQTTITASLDTGPGLSALTIASNRIYTAASSRATQLHVIRMDAPNSLVLEKKFKVPLPYATATAPFASAIAYRAGHIFIGTEKWDGNEFFSLLVSNPSAPVYQNGVELSSKVNAIEVRDGMAYVAAAGQKQLASVDIHDPSHLATLGVFSPSGWQRQEGQAISLFENSLAFGRTSGGYDIVTDHELFSFATTSAENAPSLISSTALSRNIPGGVYGIVLDRSYAFIATREPHRELQIIDRQSGALASTIDLPIQPQAMTCDGDKLYIVAHLAPFIYEISFK